MLKHWFIVLLIVLVLPSAPSALAQGEYPPRTDPFINDYAALLTGADATAVQTLLSDLRTMHGIETVVVTINSIGDYDTGDTTIESFATGLFNAWGIGDAAKNNGVLLLVAVKDRAVRIELGAGYGSGPSSEMQAVIDRYLLPKFRSGEYSAGILLGTRAMIAKLTDQPMPEVGDVEVTRVPSASTSSGTTSTRPSTSSGVESLLIVALVAMGVFALVRAVNRGSSYGDWSSKQDNYDADDDHRWNRTAPRRRSSWTSRSRSSSSSRSSSNSRKGGGRSSGGGASGSW